MKRNIVLDEKGFGICCHVWKYRSDLDTKLQIIVQNERYTSENLTPPLSEVTNLSRSIFIFRKNLRTRFNMITPPLFALISSSFLSFRYQRKMKKKTDKCSKILMQIPSKYIMNLFQNRFWKKVLKNEQNIFFIF